MQKIRTLSILLTLSIALLCDGAVGKLPAFFTKSIRSSKLPLLKESNLRLNGGGLFTWLDPRTPAHWPTYPKDVIPEDGSVGGHYSLEELCETSTYIGELFLLAVPSRMKIS